jgi:hypothetical protein
MIQQAFIDMENMFDLLAEEAEVKLYYLYNDDERSSSYNNIYIKL